MAIRRSANKIPKWRTQVWEKKWLELDKLYRDQFNEPYAIVKDVDGYDVSLPVRKDTFTNAIIRHVREEYGTEIKQSEIKALVREVEAICEKQPQRTVHLRIAGDQNRIVYSLGNDKGQSVVITPGKWEVLDKVPEMFKRYPLGGQQVEPAEQGMDLDELFKYVNIHDKLDQVMFKVNLVSMFIPPRMVHPILIFYGGQGTAKSTASRIVKQLVDPSIIELNSLSGSLADIAQFISHNYLSVFDNMNKITTKQSDQFCQAVTGGNVSKRALYTNEGDFVLPFKGCLIMNGINLVAQKPDLLDRSVPLELQRIDESSRKDETVLMDEFVKIKPRILATIFDVLSKTLTVYPTMKSEWAPRIAGFYNWGNAIALAMGGEEMQKGFIEAFHQNRKQMHRGAIAANSFAEAVLSFMHKTNKGRWEGTVSDLLDELQEDYAAYELPKTPNRLSSFTQGNQ